jgi:predicted nucleic acid-binding protein
VPTGYLLDTKVVSETRKPRPDHGVAAFLIETSPVRTFISVLTLGELYKGVAARQARDVAAAASLALWLDQLEAEYSDRVIPVDRAIARIWGELSARQSLPVVDTLIAATAITHDLTLVTRNVRDVAATGVAVLDPWQGG